MTIRDLCFFDVKTEKFRCDFPRYCPRHVLFRMEGISHNTYLPIIDAVTEAVDEAVTQHFATGSTVVGITPIPLDPKGLAVVARLVTSSAQAKAMQTGGGATSEDVLLAGWYSKLLGGKVGHIHYVQTKTLWYHNQELKPFYRPYFVTHKQGTIFVNMNPVALDADMVAQGIDKVHYYKHCGTIPGRPNNLAGSRPACDFCPYAALCRTVEKQKVTELLKIKGIVPTEKP